jgi:hypothetical protein
MLWMVAADLLPEAAETAPRTTVAAAFATSAAAMIAFQALVL